jgi:chorismate dehydratase
VHFLNTVPLVWGMMHGAQRGLFDLTFSSPAECADLLASGRVSAGLAPVAEMERLGLQPVAPYGIACRGAVRSILLAARKPLRNVRRLAGDINSRTSILLARLLLAEMHGAEPEIVPMAPDLTAMLREADAALLIGDAALRVEARPCPYDTYDLGAEWTTYTGLPMVFAIWAAPRGAIPPTHVEAFAASWREGAAALPRIISEESRSRQLPEPLVRDYLTRCVVYPIGEAEQRGMDLFLKMASRFDNLKVAGT